MRIGDYVDAGILWFDFTWLHKIPLPSWPKYIPDESTGEKYSAEEWYGDLGCFLFSFVLCFFLRLSWYYLPRDKTLWEKWKEGDDGEDGEETET